MVTVDQHHTTESNDHGHGHDHAHPPQLQHHFDTPEQQFDSSKFGMWLFLATEVLMFGGLFCAYSVYRANHPEIFIYAHRYLDTSLGALNTAVLIFSSLTMAWAVRASQKNQINLMIGLLVITLLCGFTFMGVKYVEYKSKWEHGLLWGEKFNFDYLLHGDDHGADHGEAIAAPHGTEASSEHAGSIQVTQSEGQATSNEGVAGISVTNDDQPQPQVETNLEPPQSTGTVGKPVVPSSQTTAGGMVLETGRSSLPPTAIGPSGLYRVEDPHHTDISDIPRKVHIFFGIYFTMTGLHGIHVIMGMTGIAWLIFRGYRGDFSSNYYTPVDLIGLFWHLVDLIWIYLFPLLYLIH